MKRRKMLGDSSWVAALGYEGLFKCSGGCTHFQVLWWRLVVSAWISLCATNGIMRKRQVLEGILKGIPDQSW